VLVLLAAVSCRKKNTDESYPTIQIEMPTQGRLFNYGDEISIKARIQDDNQLESIEVAITDSQGNKFLQTETFSPSNNTFDASLTIRHNDLYLTGGTYYVRIRASDGENEQFAFREIQLIEAPRQIENLLIVRDTGGSCSIDTLSGSSFLPYFQFAHEYFAGGVNSRSNQLVIGSIHPNEMHSFLYPEFESISASFPPSNDVITAYHHDQQNRCFYWGTLSGVIWKTDVQGTRIFSSTNAGRITSIGSGWQRVVVSSENVTQQFVSAIRSDNGIIETTLTIDWHIKGIIHLSSESNRILLLGNQSNTSRFAWLNLSTSAINEVYNLYEASPVISACDGSGNDFYVVHSAGIVRYNNVMNSYSMSNFQQAEKLVYDEIGNSLWAVGSQTLTHLDGSAETVLQSYPIAGLKDFWIKYNK
jgi:hypothetical protein